MSDKQTIYIRGTAYWAKILGDPVWNYGKDAKEWKMDLTLDAKGQKTLKDVGIADRIKDKDDERGKFISLRHRELRADGSPNFPIRVVDSENNKWNDSLLIGNGTPVDVKIEVRDYGKGKKHGVYIRAVRVLELKPYTAQEFAPIGEDDEYFGKAPPVASTVDKTRLIIPITIKNEFSPEEDAGFKKNFGISDDLDDVPFDDE